MGLLGSRLRRPQARLGLLAAALALAGGPAHATVSGCRAIDLLVAGTGAQIVGAEDIAIDRATGTAYIAAYDRRAVAEELERGTVQTAGGIYALTADDIVSGNSASVVDLTAELRQWRDFRPHGIDLHRGSDGRVTLFAVNRAYAEGGHGPQPDVAIEVFDLTADGLTHRGEAGTLRDAQLCSPNDIAATGPDSFLVTNDHGACEGFGRMIEDIAALDRSYVLQFDGVRFSRIVEGISFANGIAVRPGVDGAGTRLYVSATRDQAVQVYDLTLDEDGHRAREVGRIELQSAPDNLSWGPDGALYVGAHPNLLSYAAFRGGWLGRDAAPSLALRLDPDEASVAQVYFDDGGQLSGATVAAVLGDRLLLGSAYDDHVVACRLEVLR